MEDDFDEPRQARPIAVRGARWSSGDLARHMEVKSGSVLPGSRLSDAVVYYEKRPWGRMGGTEGRCNEGYRQPPP